MDMAAMAGPIVGAVLKVALVAGVGFGLARRGVLHSDALADLSVLVINVAAPCLLFANAAGGFGGLSGASAGFAILASPVVLGLGWLGGACLGTALGVEKRHWRAVVCASTYQNSAYLPIAIATATLPPLSGLLAQGLATRPDLVAGTSIVSLSLFGVLYSPLFWGLGLWWLSEGGDGRVTGRAKWVSRLLPMPVRGVLLGYLVGLTPLRFVFATAHAPLRFVFNAVSDIGGLTVPLANLILGGMLSLSLGSGYLKLRDGVTVVLAKLIFVPGVTLALLWTFRGAWRHDAALSVAAFVVFVQSMTPPATNLAVMTKGKAMAAGSMAPQVIPGLLLVAYPVSLVTMPLWLITFFGLLGH